MVAGRLADAAARPRNSGSRRSSPLVSRIAPAGAERHRRIPRAIRSSPCPVQETARNVQAAPDRSDPRAARTTIDGQCFASRILTANVRV